jgi:hypothetical protein
MKIPGLPRVFQGNALGYIASQLARGEFPDLEVLSQGLARDEETIPPTVRRFLSEHVGTIKRPRWGRPKSAIDAQLEGQSADDLRHMTKSIIARIRQRTGKPYDEVKKLVIDSIAPLRGLTPGSLEQIVWRRKNRKIPRKRKPNS